MMLKLLRFAICCVLTSSLWAAAPGGELGKLIASDSTAVVWVQNVPDLLKKSETHPAMQLWNDAEMKRFLAPMREKMRIDDWERMVKEATGRELKEIVGIAKGEMAIAVAPLSQILANPAKAEFQMQILMQVGTDKATHELIAELAQKDVDDDRKRLAAEPAVANDDEDEGEGDGPAAAPTKREFRYFEEQYQGSTLHIREDVTDDKVTVQSAWTIKDDLFILGIPKSQTIAALGAKTAGKVRLPLTESASFTTMARKVEEADVLFYTDLAPLIELGSQYARAAFQRNPQNPLGITFEGVQQALRLDVLQCAYMGLTLKPDAAISQAGLNYSENKGLVRLLVTSDKPAQHPAFLVNEAYDSGSTSFSIPNFYATLKDIANGVSPMLQALLQVQINNLRNQTGVDVERDLIAKLGEQVSWSHAMQAPTAPGQVASILSQDQVFMLELQDGPGVELAINGLMGGLLGMGKSQDLFIERDYLGFKIQQFKTPIPATDGEAERFLSYAITPKYLVISMGGSAHLERILQAMVKPTASVWERPEVKAGLATTAPNPLGVQIQQMGPMVAGLIEAMVRKAGMVPGGGDMINMEARVSPDRIAKFFGPSIGCSYRTSDGFYLRVEMKNPPAEK
jgi:hypothetical protein